MNISNPIACRIGLLLASVGKTVAHLPGVGEVMGSILGPNRIIAKDVKSCTYCCHVRCTTFIVWVGEYLGPQQAQLSTMHKEDFKPKVVLSKGWLFAIVEIKAFIPAKRSGPRFISTVAWGIYPIQWTFQTFSLYSWSCRIYSQ